MLFIYNASCVVLFICNASCVLYSIWSGVKTEVACCFVWIENEIRLFCVCVNISCKYD